jgi:hypothetical protein
MRKKDPPFFIAYLNLDFLKTQVSLCLFTHLGNIKSDFYMSAVLYQVFLDHLFL